MPVMLVREWSGELFVRAVCFLITFQTYKRHNPSPRLQINGVFCVDDGDPAVAQAVNRVVNAHAQNPAVFVAGQVAMAQQIFAGMAQGAVPVAAIPPLAPALPPGPVPGGNIPPQGTAAPSASPGSLSGSSSPSPLVPFSPPSSPRSSPPMPRTKVRTSHSWLVVVVSILRNRRPRSVAVVSCDI
jgi:hypothetical protein